MAERICSIDECDRPVLVEVRGWCSLHYQRWQRHGDPLVIRRRRRVGIDTCEVDGCDKLMRARRWCTAHYTRWKRHGSPTARLRGEVIDGCRICPGCGIDQPLDFYSPDSTGRCRACVAARQRSRREQHPDYVPVVRSPAVCDCCGEPFMADARRSRYCSQDCADLDRHRANWKHVNARRARLRGAFVEAFDRREIFERDGWVCQICELPIVPTVQWPDPGSASLDHVVPISRGGLHSRANAQAAHLHCNVVKSDKIA